MKFIATELSGAFIIDPEPVEDARGFFTRTFCSREFEKTGLVSSFVQSSVSSSHRRGTLRGMHFQTAPACEVKLVRCVAGAIYDVIVDLRRDSPTYLQHIGVELNAKNRRALYVPEEFAHGLQTLQDNSEVLYLISAFYAPDKAGGLRYNDPKLGIRWPLPITDISEKDTKWPLLD